MRIALSDFSSEVRATINQFNLDVAGPNQGQAADGKLGYEDVDQIDKALAGNITPAQRKLLTSIKDVINNKAEVARSENVDAAIKYIVSGKRPIERLKDFTSKDGAKVEVNGKDVRVKLTADSLRDLTVKERETIIEKTVNREGYWPAWTGVFVVLLFPLLFWVLFTDFSPFKRGINEDEANLLANLLKTAPARQTAALYDQLNAAGVVEKLKKELAEEGVEANEFFSNASFDSKSTTQIAAELKQGGSREDVIAALDRLVETRGDASAEDLANKLADDSNGTLARLAPRVSHNPINDVMVCREPEDIDTPANYMKEFDAITSSDRGSLASFFDALPLQASKKMWDKFTAAHDRGYFEAHMELQACANQVLSGQSQRDKVVKTLNNIATKYPNGTAIIENSLKLLRETGELQRIFPYIFRKFDPSELYSDTDIRDTKGWMEEFNRQYKEDKTAADQVIASLPESVRAQFRKDFEDFHYNIGKDQSELKTFVEKMDLKAIAKQVVSNQSTAEGAAQLLAKVRDKYKEGPAWAGEIAADLDRSGTFSRMLAGELTLSTSPKSGDKISDIMSRADLVAEANALAAQHRPRLTKLQTVLRTLTGGDAIAERLQGEFDRGHDTVKYVQNMKMEETARRVVANFSGSRSEFIAAMKQLVSKHASNEDKYIATNIADENRGTITRLFGSDINYPFSAPTISSPHGYKDSNNELDRKQWQNYLQTVIKTEGEWRKKFDDDRKADERDLSELMGTLPESTRTWVKGQFDAAHDQNMLIEKVDEEDMARAAVTAALGGSRRWDRWQDDWFSVKEALIAIQKFGPEMQDKMAWELDRIPGNVLRDRLLPIISAEMPPTHTKCTTRTELARRQQLARDVRSRRTQENSQLKDALLNLPNNGGSFAASMRDRFDAQTELQNEKWDAELRLAEAEVEAEENKPKPTT